MTGMVKTTLKPRENYNRSIILMTIAISCFYIFIINGDSAVTFPFLRSKFNWTLKKYTLFSSVHNILWILGAIFGVYLLHKLLNVIESVLIMMGLLSMLNSVLLQAVAKSDWPIYTCKYFQNKGYFNLNENRVLITTQSSIASFNWLSSQTDSLDSTNPIVRIYERCGPLDIPI